MHFYGYTYTHIHGLYILQVCLYINSCQFWFTCGQQRSGLEWFVQAECSDPGNEARMVDFYWTCVSSQFQGCQRQKLARKISEDIQFIHIGLEKKLVFVIYHCGCHHWVMIPYNIYITVHYHRLNGYLGDNYTIVVVFSKLQLLRYQFKIFKNQLVLPQWASGGWLCWIWL